MKARIFSRILGLLMTLAILSAPAWAERIKTDGKNSKSPIKVQKLDFLDSGYGQPGPNAEIRMSTVIRNSSGEDDLKNVVLKLQLKNLAGEVVQEWTKNIPLFKKGATTEFDPGGVYYNYSFNNLQPGVEIEHDKPEKKDKDKDEED